MATKEMMTALAEEMSKLGFESRTDATGEWLRVAGYPALRSPEVRLKARGYYFVWDGYSATSPTTMAKRLVKFLKGV